MQTVGVVRVRLPVELARWVRELAKREHRSINGQFIHLLQAAHDAEGGNPGAKR